MPHRGTGHGIWYVIEETDDPDALWIRYPVDIPDCYLDELVCQVTRRLGPHTYDPPSTVGIDSPCTTISQIARMSVN